MVSEPGHRDPDHERAWLMQAAEVFGDTPIAVHPFIAQVLARLDAGEQTHGSSYLDKPIAELLEEVSEEALDIAAWGVLTSQALDLEEVGAGELELIRLHLRSAAAAALTAWQSVAAAAELHRQSCRSTPV